MRRREGCGKRPAMAFDDQQPAVDLPEPDHTLAPEPRPGADREVSDAEERRVELIEPDTPQPPIDDADADPATRPPGDGRR